MLSLRDILGSLLYLEEDINSISKEIIMRERCANHTKFEKISMISIPLK
jgi:hypothetical protein